MSVIRRVGFLTSVVCVVVVSALTAGNVLEEEGFCVGKVEPGELEGLIDDYLKAYDQARGSLPALDVSFKQIGKPAGGIRLRVMVASPFMQRLSTFKAWIQLPPTLKATGGLLVWEGTVAGHGHRSFEAVVVPTCSGIHSVRAYAIGVEVGGRIVPCRCEYWLRTTEEGVEVALDADLRERIFVPTEEVQTPMDLAEARSDSAPTFFFAFNEYPTVVHWERPVYPEEARKAEIEGKVMAMVTINERGDVINVWLTESDHPVFNTAALEAAYKFRFTPAKQGNLRVKATIIIPFRFSLED